MRTLVLFLTGILVHGAEAQKNVYEERSTMLSDSLRQVEMIYKKTDKVVSRHFFIGERATGEWQEFDTKGHLLATRDMSKLQYGEGLGPGVAYAEVDTAVDEPDQLPQYPGGMEALFTFLAQNTRYPPEAAEAGIMGVVYVVGIVEKNGDWRTVAIRESVHPYLDYEAWRVTDLMPDWSPGIQDGVPVRVRFQLPLRFKLL